MRGSIAVYDARPRTSLVSYARLIATALNYHSKGAPEPGWYASLIALIPAFISAFGGALHRNAISTP
jgi:hypothetical protein